LDDRPSAAEVVAEVHGTAVYLVALRYDDHALWAHCTCPYFADRVVVCKHIWATAVECERQRIEFPGRVDDLLADDLVDDEDFGEVIPIRRPWVEPSRWRLQVGSLPFDAERIDVSPLPREITWILDPRTSAATITIEITSRSRKKNGELAKPQLLRIAHRAVASVPSPLDREILAIAASAGYGYGLIEPKWSLRWPASDYVLPKLVETGRLWIRTGPGEYEHCTAFDAGEPWRLSVRTDEQDGKYVLAGTLQRGEESIPLSKALQVTAGGFVIFRDSIARFADEGTWGWASLLRREAVEVPAAELDQFVKAIATARTPLHIDFPGGAAWKERRIAPRAVLIIQHRGYSIHGMPQFEYDSHAVPAFPRTRAVYDEKSKTIFVRDTVEEERLLDVLGGQSLSRDGDAVSFAPDRMAQTIARLIDAGWEVGGAEGVYAGLGELELEVTSGIDWFDMNGTVNFGTEEVRLPRLLAALRKGDDAVRLADGRLGLIRSEWREQLEPFLAAASEEHDDGLRFRRNQVSLLDAMLAARPEVSFDEAFDQIRRRILDARVTPEQPAKSFRGTLRPYQSAGLGWFTFLRDIGFGGCLADDMGLGKTIQVLALLDQRRRLKGDERRPSLVVAPRSVVFNWKAEAARFTPELRLLDHSVPDRVRAVDHFPDYDIVLTTYALLRKEVELFGAVEFDYAILDEAQAIKNASSQAAKAATLLRARHRLALSGTPVENHLGELASLFEFLNPGMLRAKSSRVTAMLRRAGGKSAEAADARTMLARAVRPFILRRTKTQVARELPDRVEQTIWCELEPKQRALYDELRDYYRAALLERVSSKGLNRSKIQILEALLRMRQAACHPALVDGRRAGEASAKMETLFDELAILLDGNHKVLVFSQFTSLLAIVRDRVRKLGLVHAYIDGSTRDREKEVARFQTDPSVQLFLISLKAGGLGLNLTAAEYVFLLDPWWNPAVEAQAIDRAHRIGQTRNVFAYRLVARDTIEEKILQLQQSKRELADAIVGEENSILRQLTAEDLDLLLS
jgi:superfamily II DNA or RNA helicase